MEYRAKIGVLCLGRYTYDVAASREIYKEAQRDLKTIEGIDWEIIEEPVIEKDDAEKAAKRLLGAAVDAVAIISGTFHLGHLALIIDRAIKKPVLLWAFNELPYDGGKIRLRPYHLQHLPPIDHWHLIIQQHKVNILLCQKRYCIRPGVSHIYLIFV